MIKDELTLLDAPRVRVEFEPDTGLICFTAKGEDAKFRICPEGVFDIATWGMDIENQINQKTLNI